MSLFNILLPYVDLLTDDKLGEWVLNTAGEGTLKSPKQMPFVSYSDVVVNLIRDVHTCWESTGMKDYVHLMQEHGISWKNSDMEQADVTKLPSTVILALLMGAVRAERFCDGALLAFLKNGSIQRWLIELKEREGRL